MFVNLIIFLGILVQMSKPTDVICDIDCWIRSLVIHVPTISYTVPKTEDEINLTNMIIHNMSVNTVEAEFYPNKEKINDGLLFNLTLSASLYSDIQYDGFIQTEGNLSASLLKTNIQLPLKFIKDKDGLISNVTIYDTDKCHASIDEVGLDIHFDDDSIDWLISLLVKPITIIIKSFAQTIFCQSIDPIISEYGQIAFSTISSYIRPYINGSTPIDIPIDPSKMSDLRESQVIDLLDFFLTNLLMGDSPLNINNLMNRFSKDTGVFDIQDVLDVLHLSPDLLNFNIPVQTSELNGTVQFSFEDIVLKGMNTWNNFTILNPISPFVLDTTTALQNLDINATFQLNVKIGGLVDTGDVELNERAYFHLDLANNSMNFLLQYAAEKGVGLNYTISQCTDPGCLIKLASANGTGLQVFQFDTAIEDVEFGSAEADLEEEIQETINTVSRFFIENYRPMIPVFMNGIMNEFGRSYLNSFINSTISSTECKTYKEKPYKELGIIPTIVAAGLSGLGLACLCSLAYIVHCIRKKYNENEESSKKYEKFLAFFRNDSEASLFMHPKLPLWVRILMPFLVFTCISIFLSSNGSNGASVFLKIHLGKYKKIEFPSIFDFALTKTIADMWKAKAYILSFCVAVGSCIWPYTKLVLMLIAWLIPSSLVSKKHRDRILRVLFVLGKWSLIDSYFMILTNVGFHFAIDFPIVHDMFVKDPSIVYIWVFPSYGFITLIVGTVYSLGLSHLVCYINRNVSNPYSNIEHEDKVKISVFKKQNLLSKILLVIFLPFALILFLAGVSVNSFSFEFDGLTGWAFDILNYANKKGYTVLEMVPKFPASCEHPNNIRTRIIQIIYLITAVITPILHIISLGIMLFVPMTKKRLFSMYNACEVLYSWSCLDVFTVSIFVSVVQISLLTDFMVGDACDLINEILKKFFTNDKFIKGHYKCFEINSVLENGIYILIAAAIINTVAALWINAITRKVLENSGSSDYQQVNDNPEVLMNSQNYTNEN